MKKHTVSYSTELDALISVSKRLSVYESREKMDSETFYYLFKQGKTDDSQMNIEWANDYQHFLDLKIKINESLNHAA